jgi:hypothetical protein
MTDDLPRKLVELALLVVLVHLPVARFLVRLFQRLPRRRGTLAVSASEQQLQQGDSHVSCDFYQLTMQ